jgi:uncharacterized Zn finger protein
MTKSQKIALEKKFEVCPECGYEGGFHVIFRKRKTPRVKMNLKCPSCAAVYDLDLVLELKG